MQENDNNSESGIRTRDQSSNNMEDEIRDSLLQTDQLSTSVMHNHYSTSCYCAELVISSCRRFQYKLYLALFLSQMIPTIYKTVRMFYLGNLPNSSGVDIASQLIWVNLILEVFEEGLILPLYYLIGKTINCPIETKNKFKIGVIITFGVHFVICFIIFVSAQPLAILMGQQQNMINETVHYIHFELISIPFESVNQLCIVVMTLFNWQKHLYIILVLRMFLLITSDTFFISEANFSLNFGVIGIAYGSIATALVIFIYCMTLTFVILKLNKNDLFRKSLYSFKWLKDWLNVGLFSGLDSLMRNVFYILCVIRMMNVIEKQGVYWRANEFIWNYLLLPFIPLSNLLKQDTGNIRQVINHKQKMTAYFLFLSLISFIWFITIPVWKYFFRIVMNVGNSDANDIYDLVLILLPFYIAYMVNTLLDSVLYGKGKTTYLALQSFITNLIINLPAFILYLLNIYNPNLINVAVLFGTCIVVDNVITMFLYSRYIKSIDYNI